MNDIEDVQDRDALINGRSALLVDPSKILRGDYMQDQGWIKEVEGVSIFQDGTRAVVRFVEGTPGDPCVVHVLGRDALVWRLLDDDSKAADSEGVAGDD